MPRSNVTWLWGLTAAACASSLYAALGHPSEYAFYTLARVTVCVAGVTMAMNLHETPRANWGVACGVAAFIFNPVIPMQLGRAAWVLLDIAVVPLLVYSTHLAIELGVGGDSKSESK